MNEPGKAVIGAGPGPFEPAVAALAVFDADGRVAGWTGDAERLLGYSASHLVGRSAAVLLDAGEDAGAVPAVLRRCLADGGWSGTVRARRRDGRPLSLHLRVSPLSGAGDRDTADGDGTRGRDGTAAAGRATWLVSAVEQEAVDRSIWNAAMQEALLVRSPIAVAVWDPQLRYVWVNEALAAANEIPRDGWSGRRIGEVLPGIVDAPPIEAVMRRVLATGEAALGYEYDRRTPEDSPHHPHTYSITFYRIEGADGAVLGVCGMRADVTAASRARARLDMLSAADTHVGTTLDVMRTAQELCDYAVPQLADFVTVDLVDSVLLGSEPLGRLEENEGRIPVFRRAGMASMQPGVPESLWRLGEAVYVSPRSPFFVVLESRRSLLQPVIDTSPGTWLDEDPRRAEVVHRTGMHSLMVVPVQARGEMLGVAIIVRNSNPAPFEEDDLLLAEELVGRAALSLDNARRYARERAAALALQRNLLPHTLNGGSTLEVASRYLPADVADGVGGDWYDVIPLSGARTALVVGDVVGHGINAAASMGRFRTAVRTLADLDLPPDELLTFLDRTVIHLNEEETDSSGTVSVMGGTCLYAVYDPITMRLEVARAGHPPPLVIDPVAGPTFPDIPAGAPLGLGLLTFESAEFDVRPGSTIVLYTDGLVETREHDIDFGIARLATALRPPGTSVEDMVSAVFDTVPTSALSDDATLLLARPRSLSADRVAYWELSDDPAAVHAARSLATRQLTRWGMDELVPATELIVGELVTNALLHGASPVTLRLIWHNVLVCEVSDADDRSPRPRYARPDDENGRGLVLVARSARRWGTRHTAGGKTVWAEQDLPAGF